MTPEQVDALGSYLTAPRPRRSPEDVMRTLLMLTRGALHRHAHKLHPEVVTELGIALDLADSALERKR